MSFDLPSRLLLLVAVAALAAIYLVQQVRRSAVQRRWTQDALLASGAPTRPGRWRHLPAVLVLMSLVAMTASFAGPRQARQVQREQATIVLALDTSTSMLAQDVAPDRFTAAKAAATRFVETLPAGFEVALVGYHATATLYVPPTRDHASVTRAIQALELSGGTALGDAVLASLTALRAPEGGAIVLLADGGSTTGSSVPLAIAQAKTAGVPISTIAYGTPEGAVIFGGRTYLVPVDKPALAAIADATGGQTYSAATGDQLAGVYNNIRTRLSTTTENQDIAAELAGIALALLLGAAVSALVDRTLHSV